MLLSYPFFGSGFIKFFYNLGSVVDQVRVNTIMLASTFCATNNTFNEVSKVVSETKRDGEGSS